MAAAKETSIDSVIAAVLSDILPDGYVRNADSKHLARVAKQRPQTPALGGQPHTLTGQFDRKTETKRSVLNQLLTSVSLDLRTSNVKFSFNLA